MDRAFFETLFDDIDGYIAASFMKGPVGQKDVRNRYYSVDELDVFFTQCTSAVAQGFDCYFVPALLNSKDRKKSSFKQSHVVWMDHDSGEFPNTHELEPTYVVNTSPGRHHLYWVVREPITDGEQVEAINRGLAESFGGDLSGWDRTQLLRVPGTVNFKGTPYTVELTAKRVTYDTAQFPKALGNLRLRLSL